MEVTTPEQRQCKALASLIKSVDSLASDRTNRRRGIQLHDLLEQLQLPQKIIVLARDYRYFNDWCYKVGISQRNPALRYISDYSKLYGYNPHGAILVFVGPWHQNAGLKPYRQDIDRSIRMYRNLGMEMIHVDA